MTVALWCILAAALVPYACTILAKSRRDFDNAAPRTWLGNLDGWRQRANWAQANGFEAFAPFAAGVLVAQYTGAPQDTVDAIALTFIAARIAHAVFYITDRAAFRSLVWLVGFGSMIALFVVSA